MKNLLEKAGLSFARAFGATLVILLPGVWAAPNLDTAKASALAMLFAALTAGFKAVQVLAPQVSFVGLLPTKYTMVASWLDSFARAFLGTFITALVNYFGATNGPDLSTAKAAAVAALVGAVAAGFRAVQGFVTKGESPAPQTGV